MNDSHGGPETPGATPERRLRARRLLAEAGARLGADDTRDEEAIVAGAVAALRDALGGELSFVCYTPDVVAGSPLPRWRYGLHGSLPLLHAPLPPAVGLTGEVVRSRRPRLWQEIAPEAGAATKLLESGDRFSIISLPLPAGDDVLGVLNVYRAATIPFDEEDLLAAAGFAGQIAAALERAHLYARLAETETRARDLVEHSPDAILLHTVEGRLLAANGAAGTLFGCDPAEVAGRLLTDYLPQEEHNALWGALARVTAQEECEGGEGVAVRLRYARPDGQPGVLSARICALHSPGHEGTPTLQSVVRDVTAEHRQQAVLEARVRELDALIAVGEGLNSSLDPEAVLRETLRALTAVVPCPVAAIRLYDEGRRVLAPVAVHGWPAGERPVHTVGLDDEGPIAAAVRAGEIAFVPDFGRAPGIPPLQRPDTPRALLIVPLLRGGELLGCFTLARLAGAGFDEGERRLAAAVARQTAVALENARLFGRVQRQLRQIGELQGVAADLVSDLDLDSALARICRTLADLLGADATGVRFLGEGKDELVLAASHGLSPALAERLARTSATGPFSRAALEGRGQVVVTPDLGRAPDWERREMLMAEGVRAACNVGIVGKSQEPLGILFATWTAPHEPSAEEIEMARTYANYAGAAIENARLFARTRELYLAGIQSLAAAVDARDPYTHRHSRNVAFYARAIAIELGLPQSEVENIELAALLHDIGKIGISDAILGKPGKLSTTEMSVMITHAAQGAAILAANGALAPLVPLVRHHHEWHNGGGYPDGLAGDAIPLGASIICAADAFDTMTTDRAYRRARTLDRARTELERSSGRQFNPRVVEAFVRVLGRDERRGATYALRLQGPPAGSTGELRPTAATLAEANQEEEASGQIKPQQLKELAVLHHLARTVGTITDLDRFLAGAVQVIKRELGDHDCALLLLDAANSDLVVRAVGGFDPSLLGKRLPPGQGVAGWVHEHGQPQTLSQLGSDPRHMMWRPTSRSAIGAPLISAGERIGAIVIESERVAAFSADDEMTLETIANQLAVAIAVARLHDREKRAAITDGLTGVYNHRHFYQRLEEELERAEHADDPLAVLIMDVNGLKALNDTQGHLAGDTALRTIAGLLRDCTRRVDTVARYGGDEFATILPNTTMEEARRLLERLMVRLLAARAICNGVAIGPFGMSVGIATFPEDGARAAALVAAADARMYEQKQASRVPSREATGRLRARSQVLSRLKYK